MSICYLIFILIVFQGIIGWYMVKSGLVNDITVSHYRLSIHLSTAVLIVSSIFWLLININFKTKKKFFKLSYNNFPFQILILLIFIQIVIGAFVSGLDAGKIYQTWPRMGANFLPDDLNFNDYKSFIQLDNHSLVQFYHRSFAYVIILYVLYLSVFIYKKKLSYLYFPLKILLVFTFLQALLGIFTLVSGLNIYLASIHQITSVLLIFSAINLYFFKTK